MLKNMKSIFLALFAVVVLLGCRKEFLDKTPSNQLTDKTAFVTYQNFQTYAWGLYDYFAGYGNAGSTMPPAFGSQENSNSDNISNGTLSSYANQSKLVPAAAGAATTSLEISSWNFSYV